MKTTAKIQIDAYFLTRKVLALMIGSIAEGGITFCTGLYQVEQMVDPDGQLAVTHSWLRG